jgi:hypothetical protein
MHLAYVLPAVQAFVDNYLLMVAACAERDRQTVLDQSMKLGFLTGPAVAQLCQVAGVFLTAHLYSV